MCWIQCRHLPKKEIKEVDTSFSYVWYFEVTCSYKEKGRGGRSQESLNNVDCGREGRLGRPQAGWGRGQAGKYSRRQLAPKQQRHEAILPTSMGTFQRCSSNSHYRPLPQVSASLIWNTFTGIKFYLYV